MFSLDKTEDRVYRVDSNYPDDHLHVFYETRKDVTLAFKKYLKEEIKEATNNCLKIAKEIHIQTTYKHNIAVFCIELDVELEFIFRLLSRYYIYMGKKYGRR